MTELLYKIIEKLSHYYLSFPSLAIFFLKSDEKLSVQADL